jgi:hypothetical protein
VIYEGRIKLKNCYVFGKLIFVRQFASSVSFSVHDGYRTTDLIVYEHERNFKTGELKINPFFESLMELNLKEGCYVLIRGQVYSRENSKEVSFRPYALAVIDPKDYETCKRLGFNI